MVNRRFSKFKEESDGIVQPISSANLGEPVRYVGSAIMEGDRNANVITLLRMFSKQGGEVLPILLKERVQEQGCAPSF